MPPVGADSDDVNARRVGVARKKQHHTGLVARVDEVLPTAECGEVCREYGVVRDEDPPRPFRRSAQGVSRQIRLPR